MPAAKRRPAAAFDRSPRRSRMSVRTRRNRTDESRRVRRWKHVLALAVVVTLALAVAAVALGDPPVAEDESATTKVNEPVTVFPSFSDPDGDDVAITGATEPAHGNAVCDDFSCTYTPDTD